MDVWSLVCSIKNRIPVQRVLLKNGKRSRADFQRSQGKSEMQLQEAHIQPIAGDLQWTDKQSGEANGAIHVSDTSEERVRVGGYDGEVLEETSRGILCPIDKAFKSSVLCEVNVLKHAVTSLQQEVNKLKSQCTSSSITSPQQRVSKPKPQFTTLSSQCSTSSSQCSTSLTTYCWVYVRVDRRVAQDVSLL